MLSMWLVKGEEDNTRHENREAWAGGEGDRKGSRNVSVEAIGKSRCESGGGIISNGGSTDSTNMDAKQLFAGAAVADGIEL